MDRSIVDTFYVLGAISKGLDTFMDEGLSAERSVGANDVDPEQLRMGIEVEMEHTDDPKIAEKIALDHLAEFSDYYTALARMEQSLRDERDSEVDGEGSEEKSGDPPSPMRDLRGYGPRITAPSPGASV